MSNIDRSERPVRRGTERASAQFSDERDSEGDPDDSDLQDLCASFTDLLDFLDSPDFDEAEAERRNTTLQLDALIGACAAQRSEGWLGLMAKCRVVRRYGSHFRSYDERAASLVQSLTEDIERQATPLVTIEQSRIFGSRSGALLPIPVLTWIMSLYRRGDR